MRPAAPGPPSAENRREFLRQVSAAASVSAGTIAASGARPAIAASPPWHRRTYRWGQTNITEADPAHYDIAWWRSYWKKTEVQGVIVNAGGIYAYYPSRFPLHRRPATLGDRDLYGELARAAHEDGLSVLARMDSSRAHEDLFRAHPDWFARDEGGKPFRAGEHLITCVNSPYYEEYLPGILREIIERSPTIAGAGWTARVSAIASTARSGSTSARASRCRGATTGTTTPFAPGSSGATRPGSPSGIGITA